MVDGGGGGAAVDGEEDTMIKVGRKGLSSRSRRAISASLVHATWRGNFAPLKQREHLRSTTDVAPNLIGRTFILPVDPLE